MGILGRGRGGKEVNRRLRTGPCKRKRVRENQDIPIKLNV